MKNEAFGIGWSMLAKTIGLALLCGLLGVLAACGGQVGPSKDIRIGVIAYLEGEYAETSGKPTVQAAELAVKAANAAGGLEVRGRKFQVVLVVEGIDSNPERAVEAAQKLINQENVVAIVGPQFSGDAIPVARVANSARIPMISATSTNPETTAGRRYVFRVGFVDDFQGQVVARFAFEKLGARKAAVLYDVASTYNRGIAEIFKQVFEAAGGQVVAFETYTSGEQDFDDKLARIQASGAQVLFLPNYTDDVLVQVQRARQLGIDATFLGSDSWTRDLAEHPEFDGAFFAAQWHADIASQPSRAFVEAYQQAYGPIVADEAPLTYDAFGLLFHAIQSQASFEPESIRNGLAGIHGYQGVSGLIRYEGSGDPVKSAVILQVKDGQVVFYELFNP